MFSQQTIWAMNHPDGKADNLHCGLCGEVVTSFYLSEKIKLCYTCKFDRTKED